MKVGFAQEFLTAAGFVLWVRGGKGSGVFWVMWLDGLIIIGCRYRCVEYNVSDRQDGNSGCRVLFTSPGINFGV